MGDTAYDRLHRNRAGDSHGKYSIASAAQNGVARPPHSAGGYNVTAVVATAITGVGGG